MTCYHPMIRAENLSKWVKAADGHRYHPAEIYNPDKLLDKLENQKSTIAYKYQTIPCGKCIGCRLEYSREWANRGFCESKMWKNNWFVTITYDDDHMTTNEWVEDEDGITWTNDGTWNGTLVPKELTQFIKDVRQIMQRKYKKDLKTWKEKAHNKDPKTPKKPKKPRIRFMACGEYGEEKQRPHYHIIFFNLNLPLEDLYEPRIIGDPGDGKANVYYRSHIIEQAWSKGISNVSEATWNTIAYTARYITKKINGKGSNQEYASKGQEKEFYRTSRMPGIGEPYYQHHKKEIYKNDEIVIRNKKGVHACKPPKYFDKLYEKKHPKEFEKIKKAREKARKNSDKIKDLTTSLDRLSQLEIEEATKQEASYKLIREFEKKAGI